MTTSALPTTDRSAFRHILASGTRVGALTAVAVVVFILVSRLIPVSMSVAREMAPPTLYQEGIKAQTPWLYSFLKNPDRLRYTTVLRMPQCGSVDRRRRRSRTQRQS